ncbi:methyl-accepting chemotaxis protein [Pleionea sediminis]|uniref:methyl-accepting chemotaxis protein n=1 Tax=Pleionea sediminis TaxID=2569479 RepID=UPI0013DE7198|nr:methyl-accepting chemotaxis protein [Pleionea sediminis]
MGFFSNSLRAKILIIAAGALIAIAVTSLIMMFRLQGSVNHFDDVVESLINEKRTSAEIATLFKTQVQEWKNVLLRGHDTDDRNKYWNRFLDKQNEIQDKAKKLLPIIKSGGAQTILKNFIESHAELESQYKNGYELFINNNFDHKLADKSVRGIDREPAKLLNEFGKIVTAQATEDSAQAHESAGSTSFISITVIVLLTAVLLLILFFVLNSQFNKPVSELLSIIRRFGEGDFSEHINASGTDELAQMKKQLANMQEFLQELMGQVKSTSSRLNKDADTVSRASAEIAHGTQTTSSRIEQTATAVTQMTSTVQEVAQNAIGAAESASQADSSAQNGRNVMQTTIRTINALSDEVSKASNVIQKLEEDTNSVGTVLDVIRGIAEQTNLLALNAAIEAARAGEQGRGFAVVADEVRNLAQRTQESTAEIQQIIENVQTGAKDAVAAMEQGRESTSTCVDQANQAGASLDEITSAVNEIHMKNTQIATAAEEQTTVAEDISLNVNEISESTSEIHESVRKFNELSSSLAEMAEELTLITQKVKV